ncbi:FAD-dependent monooxygenase [Pseudonocardia ailaonensis]|uniref:FAD-dependent monooxygenase n=1 Tax=Pseudonocardia ailaonensis TaxID=367279 RepID=A0ABN2NJL2_9PSEU
MTTVLVSGAGIAGPALAYWLHRHGSTVTVVESAPAPRPGGQTVDLRGAGREVVEQMGLMPAIREVAMEQEGIAYVDASGAHVAEMPVDAFGGEGIVSEIEILRGDLAQVLLDATPDVEYVYGRRVTALTDRADDVEVTFDDGTVRTFDLVVGADGPHSGIRRLAFGPEEQFVKPLGGYTAWFTAPDPVGLNGWYEMYNEPGRVASIRPDSTAGRAKAGLSFLSDPIPYDRRDIDAQRALLAARFAGMAWATPELVEAARTADDLYLDSVGQIRMDHWTRGRVALVGDAGYCPTPLTGLGTTLALVGAYVLAGELSRTPDHRVAFAAYEERMRPFVKEAQTLPPGGFTGYCPKTRGAIRMRVLTTKAMVSRWGQPIAKKLFFSRSKAIELPDYCGISA